LPIVRDFPIAGSGGGSFYNIFLSYRTPSYGYTFVDHTHNDFVEIATDYGLLGLCILGGLVAMTLATTLKVMSKRKSRLPWGIAFGVTMSIVTLLIHSTVDFNLQIPANAMTIVVILAMGWVASVVPPAANPKKSRSKVKA
jgi:O-antigen ligase